ncbi:MAG: GAF domain-containing protein [Thermoplasmata archaeon]
MYRKDGAELVLDGWDGEQPTEHERIPLGQGICGRAARENRTVRVDDVGTDPEYLACFRSARSELVVPIRDGVEVLGEIDVDGRVMAAFDPTDERFLSEVAVRLAPSLRLAPTPPPGSAESLSVLR